MLSLQDDKLEEEKTLMIIKRKGVLYKILMCRLLSVTVKQQHMTC